MVTHFSVTDERNGMTSFKSQLQEAYELTLEELFPRKLTDTICINIHNAREVWVATLMCEYLDSFIDMLFNRLVRDNDFKPIGIVGGFELLDHLRKNPTRDYQYRTRVGEIMLKSLPLSNRSNY